MTDHTHEDTASSPGGTGGLYYMLGEIRGDIRAVMQLLSTQSSRLSELEARVTQLEHAKIKVVAWGSLLAAVGSLGIQEIVSFISKVHIQ